MPLPLPIEPQVALASVIDPALEQLPRALDSDQAAVLLLAIAIQESGLRTRQQYGGPAHGLFQFETGGCSAVLGSPLSRPLLLPVLTQHGVSATPQAIYQALLTDDILAAKVARLLLWTDRRVLPALGDIEGAWKYYYRNWRPGGPRPDHWQVNYRIALTALGNHTCH
ncbi:hypothetical protein [Frateuria aurantia]|uniref:Transglycosylase family protein n=1 Tax=Frateuria aurantia (strain ATCC 33424 / DSM 6220 / KCTC 2777 / LMG 1558 / NBRC 3245 / NCIMB 13370) TaxID=767434 RepID=H8L656_FRAAD|nr:hypothetical protein [Frateuria aurantia]AFC85900.1 hypothetical protein Fraau_1478 [Frateuria aurantia DSM 6220]